MLICDGNASNVRELKFQKNRRFIKISLPGGFEPPTFRLTVERANQLRHGSHAPWLQLVLVKNDGINLVLNFTRNLQGFRSTMEFALKTPTVGVEPTTFGLEVQRASPLRHAGMVVPAIIVNLLHFIETLPIS